MKDEENPENEKLPGTSLSSFPSLISVTGELVLTLGVWGWMWCVCSHMCWRQTYSQEQGSYIIHKLLSALNVNMLLKAELGCAHVLLQAGNRRCQTPTQYNMIWEFSILNKCIVAKLWKDVNQNFLFISASYFRDVTHVNSSLMTDWW